MALRDVSSFVIALSSLVLTSCSSSHGTEADAFVRDASAFDAGSMMHDAGITTDVGIDSGPDGAAIDAPSADDAAVATDAGVTCLAADSCGARSCGRSDCGAACGECSTGFYCDVGGTCVDRAVTPPPGSECIDAFGIGVVEGARGFRVCAADPARLERCLCSGGGASAWIACEPCVDVQLEGARGERCATDAQCADPVPCHPTLRLCGERCDRGLPATCTPGTVCGIPGDIAGACLTECDSCGAGCDDSSTCRRAESGNVCVPSGYGWAMSC